MDSQIRRVLSLQLALLLVASLGAWAIGGLVVAQAVCFGVGITVTNTLMIAWRMRRGRVVPAAQPSLSEFYRSWLERYLLVGALLAVGLGGLKLMPLGLLGGFILGQVVWILAPYSREVGSLEAGSRNVKKSKHV